MNPRPHGINRELTPKGGPIPSRLRRAFLTRAHPLGPSRVPRATLQPALPVPARAPDTALCSHGALSLAPPHGVTSSRTLGPQHVCIWSTILHPPVISANCPPVVFRRVGPFPQAGSCPSYTLVHAQAAAGPHLLCCHLP